METSEWKLTFQCLPDSYCCGLSRPSAASHEPSASAECPAASDGSYESKLDFDYKLPNNFALLHSKNTKFKPVKLIRAEHYVSNHINTKSS